MRTKFVVAGAACAAFAVTGGVALAESGGAHGTKAAPVAATAAAAPKSLTLVRYFGGAQRKHWVTTAASPGPLYRREGTFRILAQPVSGTRALYSCLNGYVLLDQFVSTRSDCESSKSVFLGRIGYVYVKPPKGVKVKPLYRCSIPTGSHSEHFVSSRSDCERRPTSGKLVVEGRLGYALA
ncbi:hypothetical protein [Actinomadura rupiterrae]|uniref:hypothetical protein n=1 Tax=Actinomadura rupiterrae TaxID=559627 RepID=UPI0020A4D407|nr:hypothetical protein [Actinomadura rupiterrae]MCP2337407.1 hypothetical protein [Actinomadura rupiterrae]